MNRRSLLKSIPAAIAGLFALPDLLKAKPRTPITRVHKALPEDLWAPAPKDKWLTPQREAFELFNDHISVWYDGRIASGKTYLAIHAVIDFCAERPGSRGLVMFHTLGENIFPEYLERYSGGKFNVQEGKLRLANGAEIDFCYPGYLLPDHCKNFSEEPYDCASYDGPNLVDDSPYLLPIVWNSLKTTPILYCSPVYSSLYCQRGPRVVATYNDNPYLSKQYKAKLLGFSSDYPLA